MRGLTTGLFSGWTNLQALLRKGLRAHAGIDMSYR